MTLIELFADYVRNKKSLKDYVEIRKSMNERGEFNDKTLLQAQDDLERLQREEPRIYALMHETLDEYYRRDEGYTLEYPIDFIRQISRIYQSDISAQQVYECYKEGLDHYCRDA